MKSWHPMDLGRPAHGTFILMSLCRVGVHYLSCKLGWAKWKTLINLGCVASILWKRKKMIIMTSQNDPRVDSLILGLSIAIQCVSCCASSPLLHLVSHSYFKTDCSCIVCGICIKEMSHIYVNLVYHNIIAWCANIWGLYKVNFVSFSCVVGFKGNSIAHWILNTCTPYWTLIWGDWLGGI